MLICTIPKKSAN